MRRASRVPWITAYFLAGEAINFAMDVDIGFQKEPVVP